MLEGEDEKVAHEPQVLAIIGRDANPIEGAPNGLATRVSMPGRLRSSLRWTRDPEARVSHRRLTLTPVTLSEYAGLS